MPEDEECDHDWQFRDDSFDHEFGTEKVHSWECSKCGISKPLSHGDHFVDNSYE